MMAEGKAKYIADCAKVIERRVEILKEELARDEGRNPIPSTVSSDRAAIKEAELLARMIRSLSEGPYVSHPHDVARGRTGYGPKVY